MARCDCAGLGADGCMCALTAGANITISGTGQALDPWVVNGVPPAPPPLTEGTAIDIVANAINVDISGDADNALVLGGDGGLFVPEPAANLSSFLEMLVVNTAGTSSWTKAAYPDARWLRVRCIGGGGGGAGATSAASQIIARGGGGGGSYGESWLDVASLPASVTITVGAGGTGGAAANGAGGNGGSSSFGTFVIATGGTASLNTATSATSGVSEGGGSGGLGTHQLYSLGHRGEKGMWWSATMGAGGNGANGGSGYGTGGRGGVPGTGAQGGSSPGGGAGGAISVNAAAVAGSAGGQGAVFIEMFR